MKIALAGKGGTGKTTVTTLITTYLAKNYKVLALDADSNENLAYALDFPLDEISKMERIRHFTEDIIAHTKTHPNWEKRRVTPHPNASYYYFENGEKDEFLKTVTLTKGNISVGHLGTVDEDKRGIQSMCGSYSLMRIFLNHLREGKDDFVLLDLPAGNELLTRATVINMDEIILVVEPTLKNLTVAKDILLSLKMLQINRSYVLVNKSFKPEDLDYVAKELSIDRSRIFRLPFSQELIELDNNRQLTFDTAPHAIQDSIQKVLDLVKENPIDESKLARRAELIDKRLFPEAAVVMTEELHI